MNQLDSQYPELWVLHCVTKWHSFLIVKEVLDMETLLFVLAGDLLQTIVNKAWQNGVLKHPVSDNFGDYIPIIQYADTLLILPGDARILFNLKGLLRPFSDSIGLHVNFSKSFLVPINMSDARAHHLANTFGCKVGNMPFTYLGLPLGNTIPTLGTTK